MKIVQINAVYGEKSTGTIIRDLDLLIQERKNDSFVVYKESSEERKNGIALGNLLDWKYHALRTRLDGKQGYSSYFATLKLIKQLKKINPDIIHLHNIHSNFLNFPILIEYVKKKEISLVLTLHDCWFFTGKCYHFADIGCEKWKTECNNCPKRYMDIPSKWKDSSSQLFRERIQLFNYNRLFVVGCSHWITDMASQSPILKKAKFSTIYNGIDTNVFSPIEVTENRPFTIVTMANKWFETKNIEVRNRILQFLGYNDRLLIIGCTSEKQKIYVDDNRVNAIGYVRDRKALAKNYSQGNVFLNLTHIDNLPTVNMEAASCGIPVITYDVGGSGELVKNGVTGYIVKVDDVDGIIDALDKVRQGNISQKSCRDYAIKYFDKERNYQKYMTLYQNAVNNLEENINESGI